MSTTADFARREALQAELTQLAADGCLAEVHHALVVDFEDTHREHPQYADALEENVVIRIDRDVHHRGNPSSYVLFRAGDYALAHRWGHRTDWVVFSTRNGWDVDMGYVGHLIRFRPDDFTAPPCVVPTAAPAGAMRHRDGLVWFTG